MKTLGLILNIVGVLALLIGLIVIVNGLTSDYDSSRYLRLQITKGIVAAVIGFLLAIIGFFLRRRRAIV